MRNNKRSLRSLLLISLLAQSAVGDDAPMHYQFKPGDSFFFVQKVSSVGKQEQTYSPGLKAWALNGSGGMIFAVARDAKDKSSGTPITQTVYGLEADACVVDVVNGIALASGHSCKQPLPTGQRWTVKNKKSTYECELMTPATEHVSVAAGEFDTTRIECRSRDPSTNLSISTNYWYAPSIGAMVKTIHRGQDSSGNELFVISEELDRYRASP